jgi:hypothetical protein
MHCPCARLSGVWIFTRRYRSAVVDFIIMPLLGGSGAFHLALKLFYPKNQPTLIYHIGTVPISQQRNYPYCSFMVLGYIHLVSPNPRLINQSTDRSLDLPLLFL